jgi:ferritin-like metal-binding protein YciE
MEEFKGMPPADAGIIGAAQAVEHYEIARYGTLKTWAGQLGMNDAARLLDATLAEEKKADKLLSQIAESIANPEAEGEETRRAA